MATHADARPSFALRRCEVMERPVLLPHCPFANMFLYAAIR